MATLATKIKLYCEANSKTIDFVNDVRLANDGDGKIYIKHWNVEGITKPTHAQLDALESEADDYEYNLSQIAKRKAEYGSLEQQMENIMENGVTAEKSRVQSIKEKYPKR